MNNVIILTETGKSFYSSLLKAFSMLSFKKALHH